MRPPSDWAVPDEPVDPNAGVPPPWATPAAMLSPEAYGPYPRYAVDLYPPGSVGPGYPVAARPGQVAATAVLSYICAGLLLVAALLLFLGASIVSSVSESAAASDYSGELAVDGVLNVLMAGLLICGAALLSARRPTGRVLLAIGSLIVAGAGVYWAIRVPTGGIAFYVVLFLSLPAIAMGLAWAPNVSSWLGARR